MAECINYNCAELPEYDTTIQNCAANVIKGGFSALYLLECDADLTDAGSMTELNSLVTAGNATLITSVKGGWGAPNEVTVEPITSCGTQVTTNYEWEAKIEDFKVTPGNTEFWDAANRRSFGGVVFVECPTEGLTARHSYVNAEVKVQSFREMPNSNNEAQKYSITLRWKSLQSPQIFEVA
jgi:hypothetical protein